MKMHKIVLESSNIINRSNYEYLKSVIADMGQKAAPLREKFEKCSKLCELYSEITKTYYEISKGDYISRLIEEQRKTADAEGKKTYRIT